MAQYEITCACGHKHTYNLFGAGADRQRKIAWLEGQDCPECGRAKALERAQADETPVTAKIKAYIGDRADDVKNGTLTVVAVYEGGTYRRKEDLKASGATYGEIPAAGMLGLFGRAKKGWYRDITISRAALLALTKKDASLLVSEINAALPADCAITWDSVSPDIALLGDELMRAVKQAQALDAAEKDMPPRPEGIGLRKMVGADPEARWNGKFYGNTVYLDGKKYNLTAAQMELVQQRSKAWDEYYAACKAVREKHGVREQPR